MVDYPNFYENLEEARRRLQNTIITYAEEPFVVLGVREGLKDKIFRLYLAPIGYDYYKDMSSLGNHSPQGADWFNILDEGIKQGLPLLRKKINSPHFNRFRPFSLGMCNYRNRAVYVARQPTRKMEQGLTQGALNLSLFEEAPPSPVANGGRYQSLFTSPSLRDCIVANHPTAQECLDNLLDPDVANPSAAFSREFALTREVGDTIGLAYRANRIGILPENDFSRIRLGRQYQHCREVVAELGLFTSL